MKLLTIYWCTKNQKKIARIRERFGIPNCMSINGETKANIKNEDLSLLRETEAAGLIQIRNK